MRLFGLAAVLALLHAATTGPARADAAAGEAVFQARCKICHTIAEGGKNGIGPNLFGVFERATGFVEGFSYSKAHLESGVIWDAAVLDRYLEDTKAVVPNTKKVFAGIKSPEERASLVDYLKAQR